MAKRLCGAVLLTLLVAVHPAAAQELRIGLSAEPSSIDPLFFTFAPNNLVRTHIFDQLVRFDGHGQLLPGLAESWKPIDDTTWEFRLRPGVTFHDGSTLTPDDVVFSIDRADKVPNSPGSFAVYTKAISGVEITGPLTLRVHTRAPDAYVPRNLGNIAIQALHAAERRKSEDFNSGAAAIGTGPYRFVEWRPGTQVVLSRNEMYWGVKPDWAKVTLRPLTTNAAREVALMTGEADVIQAVPPQDAERLAAETGLRIVRDLPFGVMLLALDQFRDNPPLVFDADGKPMERNPFKDRRVRLAFSKAINRDAIVQRIMGGAATPAGQMLPDGYFGGSARLKPEVFDPDGARTLLAQAGYPHGFRVTLHGPNDRFPNDAATAQAVAQMLSRVGVKTEVVVLPSSVFYPRLSRSEFSFALFGWLSSEMLFALKGPLATVDPVRGWGAVNRSGYSNPHLDALLDRAQTTFEDTSRAALLAEASEVAMADVAAIPLYHAMPLWGMRKTLMLDTKFRAHSLAANIHTAKPGE